MQRGGYFQKMIADHLRPQKKCFEPKLGLFGRATARQHMLQIALLWSPTAGLLPRGTPPPCAWACALHSWAAAYTEPGPRDSQTSHIVGGGGGMGIAPPWTWLVTETSWWSPDNG